MSMPRNPAAVRGRWYDELEPGESFHSPGRTLTEADLVNFAGLSGDYTALHTDEAFASRTPFRTRIAHGMLVQSIATGLAARTGIFEGTIAALPAMSIEWRTPAVPGDTLRLELEVVSRGEPSRRSGEVHFRAIVRNQRDQVVTEGTWRCLMLRDREAVAGRGAEGE